MLDKLPDVSAHIKGDETQMWNLNSTFALSRSFTICANAFTGTLAFQWDENNSAWTGNVFGDPLSDIVVSQNFVRFRRNGNGFQQVYSGSIVDLTIGQEVQEIVLMGTFTHDDQGCFGWTTEIEALVL